MKDLISQTRLVAAQRRAARRLQNFGRSEDGAIVAYTLFVLLLMLAAGGIAVDVMRQEMERAHLQNTADTAVLAAAGAPYGSDQKAIVEDYFAKAGLSSYLHAIDDDGLNDDDDIITTLNASKVSISASRSLDTYLMKLSGVDTLTANAASSAERRVPKLEVAMVLDVSGSMRRNSKLSNLKTAGKQFVTTILNGSNPGDAVISVVPFSWDVTPGLGIFDALNVDKRHTYSTCLQFSDSDFNNAAIDPDVMQTQLIYTAMEHSGFDNLDEGSRTCYTDDYAEILPFSTNETDLHGKIDALVADGNTSGNTGMKWGAALLDPKFQKVKLSLDGITDENATSSIPSNYNEAETLKIIVMMGDGQNTYSNQFEETSAYRGPNSYLWKVTYEDMVFDYAYHVRKRHRISYDEWRCSRRNWECVYSASTETAYFLYEPFDDEYESVEHGYDISAEEFEDLPNTLDGWISTEQLSWEMAWGMMSPDYLDDEIGYYDAESEFEGDGRVQGWKKDNQMDDICTAIKDKGVVVYTIGFEVSVGGTAETELKKCATSPAHYYRAQGININDAFSSIASNVVNLRLTQ